MSFCNGTISATIDDESPPIQVPTVQFSPTTKVWEFDEEEIKATWLTKEDIAKIQRDNLKIIKRMRRGKIDEENDCTRGLEFMRTAEHSKQRKMNKKLVLNAVLTEQIRQRLLKYYDPIKIRNLCTMHSKWASDEALRLGASDTAASIQQKGSPPTICRSENTNHERPQSSVISESTKCTIYSKRASDEALRLGASDTAASIQQKGSPPTICRSENTNHERPQSFVISQSIKSKMASVAAVTMPSPLQQLITGIPKQLSNLDSAFQLYANSNTQDSSSLNSSNDTGRCNRSPRASAA